MNPPRRGTPDFLLLFLTLALIAFGLLMVFSASAMSNAYHYDGDALFFTKKQAMAIGLGAVCMFLCMNQSQTRMKKWAMPFFLGVLAALFLVPFIGVEVKGARSWFRVLGFQLQPAEFAKLGIILYLSFLISKKQEKFRQFRNGLMPALLAVALVSGLIMLQPDFGSTMILCLIALVVIMVGGANLKHIGMLAGLGAAAGGLGIGLLFLVDPEYSSYRVARITTFLHPWADEKDTGYHIVNSLYAFGHGGLMGTGFGQSIQKLHYLPAPHNDFIFSIIGEELGFVGSTIFLIVYMLFIWRGIIVSLRCTDPFGSLVGIGIMSMIGIQALINLGGVTNAIPLTGVTLPLISYGGSSMLCTMISLGLLLGISREQNKPVPEASSIRNTWRTARTKTS